MQTPCQADRIRIYIGESDAHEHQPMYQWLVRRARAMGLAGATVLRGIEGFGAHSRIHTARILRLSEDLPMIVEIIDQPDNIDAFLADIEGVVREGLVTREQVEVHFYRPLPGDRHAS